MFSKDLLLFDIETSGLDSQRHDIIQLAAILLDKKTLKEKQQFSSFIKLQHPRNWDKEAAAVHHIDRITLKTAPTLTSVLRKFNRTFGANVILAHYGGIIDISFLQAAYARCHMRYPFDHHVFDIWGLFYTYAAFHNKFGNKRKFPGFGLEDLIQRFNIATPPLHDALVDVVVEAEILRRVITELRP